jgi:hypothetical protein
MIFCLLFQRLLSVEAAKVEVGRVIWERGEEAIMDVVDCPNLAQMRAEGTLRKAARSALTCSSPEAAVKMTTVCVLTSARYYECALL